VPYAVAALLEGETRRKRLQAGPIPSRKALDIALFVSRGLAAAHQKGIVHRDLKPENIFLVKGGGGGGGGGGGVKVLDFGLAKLDAGKLELAKTLPPDTTPEATTNSPPPSTSVRTTPGVILGSLGYMAPEQVRGLEADARADLFAIGAILYEMLTGERAFPGDTAADAISAILREDPPALGTLGERFSPAIQQVVRRAVEKNVDDRFQTARDLGFALESLQTATTAASTSTTSSTTTTTSQVTRRTPAPRTGEPSTRPAQRPVALLVAVAVIAAVAGAGVTWRFVRHTQAIAAPSVEPPASLPDFTRLTYRRGTVQTARFASGSIVYTASWEGQPAQIFTMVAPGAGSTPIGPPGMGLLAVSRTGNLALLLDRQPERGWDYVGTLAEMPIGGGAPRAKLDGVHYADYGPDGTTLAVVTDQGGSYRLEYPIGNVLYRTTGWIGQPRVSADGNRIAFCDHPWPADDRGRVAVVDKQGTLTVLSDGWSSLQGLSWSAGSDEVWFTGSKTGSIHALYAASLAGVTRPLVRIPGDLQLLDVAADGRVLLTRDDPRKGLMGLAPGASTERDLSWLDWSRPNAISADGSAVLFDEEGDLGGPNYSVYLRPLDGSPAERLGDGEADDLSADGQYALATTFTPPALLVLPVGAGTAQTVDTGDVEEVTHASWLPDGRRIVFAGHQAGHGTRYFVQDTTGGGRTPVTPEGVSEAALSPVSPDGRWLLATAPSGEVVTYPLELPVQPVAPSNGDADQGGGATGGAARKVPGLRPGEVISGFCADGKSIYVFSDDTVPAVVERLELATGARTPWKRVGPPDPAGVVNVNGLFVSRDGRAYVYSYMRMLSDLYLVQGLK
jgi:dipeptidyl aminopeptidase/acylaminoacyl peptidase